MHVNLSVLNWVLRSDMPAEFQKAINFTLTNCKNTYAFLDDILIITKGSIVKHKEKL